MVDLPDHVGKTKAALLSGGFDVVGVVGKDEKGCGGFKGVGICLRKPDGSNWRHAIEFQFGGLTPDETAQRFLDAATEEKRNWING